MQAAIQPSKLPSTLSQLHRRVIVAVLFAAITGIGVACWWRAELQASDWPLWPGAIAAMLLITTIASYAVLRMATQATAEKREHQLDERQLAVRGDAFRYAYYIAYAMFTLGVFLSLATESDWFWDVWRNAVSPAALLALFAIPTAIVAWIEPDPPVE